MSHSSTSYEPFGRLSSGILRIGRSRVLRDCRTYYRFALFAVSLTAFLDALTAVLSIFKFAILDFISFSIMTILCIALAACIHYLKKYSDMPESDHWLTKAPTHIAGSSLLAFTMFSYSSSLRAPFSSALRVCLTVNTKEFFGNVRCKVVSVMYAISWVAPFPMLIAAWVIYFSAVGITDPSTRVWRQVNVAELNEPQGELILP